MGHRAVALVLIPLVASIAMWSAFEAIGIVGVAIVAVGTAFVVGVWTRRVGAVRSAAAWAAVATALALCLAGTALVLSFESDEGGCPNGRVYC